MHHYCVVVAKSAAAERPVVGRLEQFVRGPLSFEPDEIVLHRLRDRVFVFSVSAAQRQLGIESPVHLTEDDACMVGGLPTFERFPQFAPSDHMRPAAWMSQLLRTSAMTEIFEQLGGSFSATRVDAEGISAKTSFCGYDSLFHLDNADYAAVGNRAALVASFQTQGPHAAIDAQTLSWVPATTMILGTDTPWREVERLPTDRLLTIRDGRVETTRVDDPLTAPREARAVSCETAVVGLVDRLEWYLRTGVPFNTHLTGGKDSRTILALLHATGSIERIGEIVTNGSEENGDVIVARRIAEELGLKNHVVRAGAKVAVENAKWRHYQRRFRFSPWKYDMYLTPYDGWGEAKAAPSELTTFMGGGGELIRQNGIAPDAAKEPTADIIDRFTNWHYRHDALKLLSADARTWQRQWIRAEVEALIEGGVTNLQQWFYVEQRMANWGNAHLRNNPASSIPALIDFELARLMQGRPDMADELPYEILTHCAPQLRGIPFVNDEWEGHTGRRAEADGMRRDPFPAATGKSFPWQFALYRQHRDDLLRACLPAISAWDGMISASRIEQLLDEPAEPFDSSHVKMLFGLVAGTYYLNGELSPQRDFPDNSNPPRLRGNESAAAQDWFAHRRQSPRRNAVSRNEGAEGERAAVCVLGMSRSGTSVTARVLDLLGVYLGTEDELMPAAAGNNPAGFFEHQGIADLNEEILAVLGDAPRQRWRHPPVLRAGWERDSRLEGLREEAASILRRSFGGRPVWGWKDPRTCLTLPFWRRVLAELPGVQSRLRYVICVRHPLEVAASLRARDDMAESESFALWLRYMTDALAHTAGEPRAFVSYEAYFTDRARQVAKLAELLGRPAPASEEEAAIAAHLDEGLRHHRTESRDAHHDLPVGVDDLYARLTALTAQA